MFISFIFPCHNEEEAISKVLPKIIQAKYKIAQGANLQKLEILIVNDGSQDKSLEQLEKYKSEVHIVSLKNQKGYGSAIKKGIQQAQGDWIAFCDLDDTCQAQELELLIDLANRQSLEVVWGNRLNKTSQMPFIRKVGNRFYQFVFFLLSFKFVPDPCSGFRLFKKSVFIKKMDKFPEDLSFSLAFTAHCIQYKIPFSAVDISYKKRLGKSKLHFFKDGFIFLLNLIRFLFFK